MVSDWHVALKHLKPSAVHLASLENINTNLAGAQTHRALSLNGQHV